MTVYSIKHEHAAIIYNVERERFCIWGGFVAACMLAA